MKKLPIGISDFKEVIEEQYYYIDKTLLVQEITESPGEVLLLPRPRRFGKTLNLSMLRYFFEKTDQNTEYLFAQTAIWQQEQYKNLQGTYPVIFLTFKDVKENSWEKTYKKIAAIIAREFKRHLPYLQDILSAIDAKKYMAISDESAHEATYSESLFVLSELLHKKYQKRVMILIDEYDAPIHAAYNDEYYDDCIAFMRSLLTSALKDNQYLERGILTGILRTAKEGIFSGLNNLKVCSILDVAFQDKFGFTQPEVKQLLDDFHLSEKIDEVQQWYNGYTFGKETVYNPWSLLMYVDKRELRSYWINTSDNKIIKKLLTHSAVEVKTDIETLLAGNTITKTVDEAIVFPGIEHNDQAIWSLLLFTGYVTYTSCQLERGKIYCNLIIPNEEVKLLYEGFIQDIVQSVLKTAKVTTFLQALVTGDVQVFATLLQEFVLNSMSMYDIPNDEPEKSYHLFVLGLLVYLADTYQVKSNRESGYGRYDIMLIPHDTNKLGIIIEFKKVLPNETLELAAQRALEQIKQKRYVQELKSMGMMHIKILGIACNGKQLLVLDQDV